MDFLVDLGDMTPDERSHEIAGVHLHPCRRRHAAVVVEDPHIVVVEGPTTADPGAVHDALELLVKWAVRARLRKE